MENRAWAQLSRDWGTVDWLGPLLTCQTSGHCYLLRKSEWYRFCIITVRAGITASNLITKIAKFRNHRASIQQLNIQFSWIKSITDSVLQFFIEYLLFKFLSLATETAELITEICKSWSSLCCQIPLSPSLKKIQLTRVRRIGSLHASHA